MTPTTPELRNRVATLHDEVVARETECRLLTERIDRETENQHRFEEQQHDSKQASLLIEQAATDARMTLKQRFEEVGGALLRAVFGENYELVVVLEEKRNATWATFGIIDDENQEAQDPLFSRGGSRCDIVALAIRLVYMEEDGMVGPLILDEPGKCVEEERRPDVAAMIQELHQMTGRQIIMVTHHAEFKEMFPDSVVLER